MFMLVVVILRGFSVDVIWAILKRDFITQEGMFYATARGIFRVVMEFIETNTMISM